MRSLNGRTVLVTRSSEDAQVWREKLESLGARAIAYPCVSIEPLRSARLARRLATAVSKADWLVVTSQRGAEAVAELLDSPVDARVGIAAVGPATARACEKVFGRVDLVSPRGTGSSLAEELVRSLERSNSAAAPVVVVAAADRARRDLDRRLVRAGLKPRRFSVYRTRAAPPKDPPDDLGQMGVDTILLASPSAAEGLVARARVPASAAIVTIGPVTTRAARRLNLSVAGQAQSPSFERLVEAIP